MIAALTLVAAMSGQMVMDARDRIPMIPSHHGSSCMRHSRGVSGPRAAAQRADRVLAPVATMAKNGERRQGRGRITPGSLIDSMIFRRLAIEGIEPAPAADDAAFLRRVTLDLAGRLPTAEEVLWYLASTDTGKREILVDRVMDGVDAIDRWTLWLRDLAGVYEPYNTVRGRNAVTAWLRWQVVLRRPVDEIVRGLIAANGDTRGPDPADIVLRWIDAPSTYQDAYDNMAANVSERFLGVRVLCISCHDGAGHLENVNTWLAERDRRQLWEMAAFFAGTGIDAPEEEEEEEIDYLDRWFEVYEVPDGWEYEADTDGGDRPPRWGGAVAPKFILNGEGPLPGEGRREALARLITTDPQFARNIVNRVWKELMVVGLVEPVADWDFNRLDPDTSSPLGPQTLHPELLDGLAEDFVESGYDLRKLVRDIATSRAYALSTGHPRWQPGWAAYYARKLPRRLSAEEVVDAVVQAGGRPGEHWVARLEQPVSWARQLPGLWDPNLDADQRELSEERRGNIDWDVFGLLNLFGRGNNYDEPRSGAGSISQSLAVMNSLLVNRRSYRDDWGTTPNRIQRLIEEDAGPAAAVEELFLATLSRLPTERERTVAERALETDLAGGLEDLFWALVNTQEFLFRP